MTDPAQDTMGYAKGIADESSAASVTSFPDKSVTWAELDKAPQANDAIIDEYVDETGHQGMWEEFMYETPNLRSLMDDFSPEIARFTRLVLRDFITFVRSHPGNANE